MLMDVRYTKLPGGAIVVSSALPHVESVALGIWVAVGGRHEDANIAGISHFIEHMLFKGTRKRSASDISRAIEGRGGYLNAFTQEESTCYYAKIPYNMTWSAFDVLNDMYMNSLFAIEEIDKERGVIIEEIMMYRDQPHHVVQEELSSLLWQDHPLGRPVIGYVDTLKRIKRKDISDYVKSRYVPSNTLYAFSGRVDHDACVKRVLEATRNKKDKRNSSCSKVTSAVRQGRISLMTKEIEQTHLALGVRLFGRTDERRYILKVLNTVLGENMSSRLFQVVREKHGLAYSVSSSCHLYADSGALVIGAGLDKKRYGKALELIVGELKKLKERPVGESELKRARDYVTGQIRLGLETTSSQMMWLGDSMITYGRIISPEEVIDMVARVNASDVQKMARQIFQDRNISLAMIAPAFDKGEKSSFRGIIKAL